METNRSFYGGWVAPNIYYLGSSNNLTYKSISLAGLSGIYKRYHYNQGHHERLPYTEDTKRSIYHIREFEVHKLSLITSPTVFMSHDWPTGIHKYGDAEGLLRRKRHFRDDIERGELGSWPAEMLLRRLKPWYWFSAHLHVKFAAFVDHDDLGEGGSGQDSSGQVSGLGDSGHVDAEDDEGEIVLEDSDDEDQEKPVSPGKRTLSHSAASESSSKRLKQSSESDLNQSTEVIPQKEDTPKTGRTTRFLALDKCLPHRDFLQILDIDPDPTVPYSDHLSYSPEWLAITRTFHPYLSTALKPITMPSDEELRMYIPFPASLSLPLFCWSECVLSVWLLICSKIEENLRWVTENVKDMRVPENFEVVAPVHDDTDPPPSRKQRIYHPYLSLQSPSLHNCTPPRSLLHSGY